MSGKILIVDDLAINRIILKVKLSAACHESLQAADGQTALDMARSERPRLILLDMMLPDISGIEVCRQLRADPLTRDIPVVIVTASSDRDRRLEALAAGADEFLTKPLNEVILLARIRSLLRASETEAELRLRSVACRDMGFGEGATGFDVPGKVVLIAADAAIAMGWRAALAPHLRDTIDIRSPTAALGEAGQGDAADLYIIGADLGAHGSGLRLVSDLRSREASRHAAISLVLPEAASETAATALDLGASDLVTSPFDAEETALRIALHIARKRRADSLRRQVRDGMQLAITDPLTGLFNRRYALTHLDRIAQRARQSGRSFAAMVLDLDLFKSINDRYGHAAGDAVLSAVAQRLRDSLRAHDLVARIGGEEFLVVLAETSAEAARATAERLCHAIQARPFTLPRGAGSVPLTISVGLAMGGLPAGADTAADAGDGRETLEQADRALLAAKSAGRNTVTTFPSAA